MLFQIKKKPISENGDSSVLSNGKKHYSHEDIQTANKIGRKESRKSVLTLFRGKKKNVENVEVDVLSSSGNSGNSVSEDDLQEKEIHIAKESKKSVLSLFSSKKNIIECKT